MRWAPLIWAFARRKPTQSVLTFLSLVAAFFLIGSMAGLKASFDQHIEDARADRIVVIGRFSAWLPLSYAEQIARLDGIKYVASTGNLMVSHENSANSVFLIMTDPRFGLVQPELGISSELFEELREVRNGIIASRALADRLGWAVGDQIPLEADLTYHDGTKNWPFRVVGIVPDNERYPTGFAIGNFAYLNQGRIDEYRNQVSNIHLLVDDPGKSLAISLSIENFFANSPVSVLAVPERTAIEVGLRGLMDIEFVTYAISASALFMVFFLTANVMAMSIRERAPELATLMAIGFSKRHMTALVFAETFVLVHLGACIGLALSNGAPALIELVVPGTMTPVLSTDVVAFSLACAMLLALASTLPATWRLRGLTLAEALGGR